MDGVQAAAAINSQQDVPIVYLTANSDEATLQRAKGTGPFGFLVKPFEERAIQAGIEMALYKHQTDKQIREREQWLSTTLTSIADAVITTDAEGQRHLPQCRRGTALRLDAAPRRWAGPTPKSSTSSMRRRGLAPMDRVAAALQRRRRAAPSATTRC